MRAAARRATFEALPGGRSQLEGELVDMLFSPEPLSPRCDELLQRLNHRADLKVVAVGKRGEEAKDA